MVCSNAMKKKKQKQKQRAKHDNWDLLKRSQYSLYIFTYFCYKRLLLLAKQFLPVKVVTVSPNLLATLVHPTPQ